MEVTIEMISKDLEDSFTTILDDNTELINIAEMIKEASYYNQFNLSEQFCLEIKDTNKFISGRSTIIKKCLQQNQIDPKILVFHKGMDGQTKMNKGVIIDQNFQREPQINNQVNHNKPQQQQFQPQQDNLIQINKNNQQGQGQGIVIGGGQITESQVIRNLEQRLNQGQQNNDIEAQDLSNQMNLAKFQQDKVKEINSSSNKGKNPIIYKTHHHWKPIFKVTQRNITSPFGWIIKNQKSIKSFLEKIIFNLHQIDNFREQMYIIKSNEFQRIVILLYVSPISKAFKIKIQTLLRKKQNKILEVDREVNMFSCLNYKDKKKGMQIILIQVENQLQKNKGNLIRKSI
ncbi:unnamed protein product (macronuclear) [Paramecium tetraurelia]|uniref:Uncharacterized protein n=1 Tax=Paramecium tetraurelia TaxID=5888 RepID=A0DAD1_PARTE|nr:uncharacterized protein GSPATT00014905001 [Paramecium tetraurelia]CAK79998.1 unnamed protein product [Paramecium tetraurelia]|eukprot:XP_001447395.1 hypothetical protein (macronuclear) [Paramecium tetraurelia strain d4-2]